MRRAESKNERLQQIEALLLNHPQGMTQAEMARRLSVNRSTISRNLDAIGAPIYEERGRYVIDREVYLVNVRLTLHEALAVHLAGRLLATRMDRQNPHAASALRKLGTALEKLAPLISKYIGKSADQIDDPQRLASSQYLQVLEQLTIAWSLQRKVRLWYAGREPGKTYVFSPYFIEAYAIGQSLYVMGGIDPNQDMRTFKVERIERVEALQETYEIPDGFNIDKLLSNAWGIWYSDKEPVEVVLKFGQRVAQRVRETRWHRSEQVVGLEDGSLLWRAWVAEPQEMMHWIRGWGQDVEVLAPEGLVEVMKVEVERMARNYGIK